MVKARYEGIDGSKRLNQKGHWNFRKHTKKITQMYLYRVKSLPNSDKVHKAQLARGGRGQREQHGVAAISMRMLVTSANGRG